MFFGRLVSNLDWIKKYVGLHSHTDNILKGKIFNNLKLNLLIFSRWSQVMYRFEKAMYTNPKQELNDLWWNLVEEYQQLKRPENRNSADWAAKIHVALYPAYYHNYLLGEMLASQLKNYLLVKNNNFFEGKEIGKFLKINIFKPGAKFHWKELILRATGEELNPSYFVKDITNNL
jgi:peptidyl-dipeptidase A